MTASLFLKKTVSLLAVIMIALSFFAISDVVQASGCEIYDPADPLGTDCAANTGLSSVDPRIIVGRLIRVVLGLIGIIMVTLIIWAGFTWMTAAGESDKIDKAKQTISAAIVGLVIILMSYAITTFITTQLLRATSGR